MRTQITRFIFPALIVTAMFLGLSVPSRATVAMSKKEGGAKCVVCHTAMGKKDLNDTGKCYQDKKSLDSCKTK